MNDLFLILSEEILFTITLNEKSFSILFDGGNFYLDTRIDGIRRKQPLSMEQLEHIYNNEYVKSRINADFTNLQAQKLKFAKGKDNAYKLMTGMLRIDDKNFTKIAKVIDLISLGYTYHLTDDTTIYFTGKYKWSNDYLDDSHLRISQKGIDDLGDEKYYFFQYSQEDIINLISSTIDRDPTAFEKKLMETEKRAKGQENFKKTRFNELINYKETKQLAVGKEQKSSAKKWLLTLREKLVNQKGTVKEAQKSNGVDLVEYFDSMAIHEDDDNMLVR